MKDRVLFDLRFQATTLAGAVEVVMKASRERRTGLVVTPNVDHIVVMQSDMLMKHIYSSAMAVFADGMPIVWLSRFTGDPPLPERVTGADLLPAVCEAAARFGDTVFLLGGNPGVAAAASNRLCALYPDLRIAGYYCPPFGFDNDESETARTISMINESNADILCIGVGTPKQEKWAYRNLNRFKVGPILCIGASLDFAAGTVRRSPEWLQRAGLEWCWRLAREPHRLWRRYLVRGPRFLKLATREILGARPIQ